MRGPRCAGREVGGGALAVCGCADQVRMCGLLGACMLGQQCAGREVAGVLVPAGVLLGCCFVECRVLACLGSSVQSERWGQQCLVWFGWSCAVLCRHTRAWPAVCSDACTSELLLLLVT